MSNNVDNRIVEMQFDNRQFEQGIHTSINSLDNLKKSLKMDGVSDGLENVGKSVKKLDFSRLGESLLQASDRFNSLGTIAGKTIDSIKNALSGLEMQAIRTIKSLTFDQVGAGLDKYGEKMTAVRTIMAATGKDVGTVDKYLSRLNEYTDQTSYNFTEMAGTIGKFTAAGVELDDAERAMEGIANWAARSGVNAQNASPAFYNLAQAIGSGQLKLQDWKSIENANMATKEFKDSLIEAGIAAGTLKKTSKGIFTADRKHKVTSEAMSQSLQYGWATRDVLMATLNRYYQEDLEIDAKDVEAVTKAIDEKTAAIEKETDATKKKRLEEERDLLIQQKQRMESYMSAREARSVEDVFNALKDAVSTGWMNSFELIFGDVEQAAEFFTGICDTIIDDVIDPISTARNKLLEGWNFLGGRDSMINSLQNLWEILKKLANPIGEAFNKVFGKESITVFNNRFKDITDKGVKYLDDSMGYYGSDLSNFVTISGWSVALADMTKKFEDFTTRVVNWFEGDIDPAEETVLTRSQALVKGLSGVFAGFDILKKVLSEVGGRFVKLVGKFAGPLVDKFLKFFADFGDKMVELDQKLSPEAIKKFVDDVIASIKKLFGFGKEANAEGEETVGGITGIFDDIKNTFNDNSILRGIKGFVEGLIQTVKNLTGAADGVDLSIVIMGVLGGIAIFAVIRLVKKITNTVGKISEIIGSIGDGVSGIIDTIKDKFSSKKSRGMEISEIMVNVGQALAAIASAVYMISRINPDQLVPSLLAVTGLLVVMTGFAFAISKMKMDLKTSASLTVFATSMTILGAAVILFAKAVQMMGSLGLEGALVGIGAMTIILAEMLIFVRMLGSTKQKLDLGAIAVIGMLGDVVRKFADVVADLGQLDKKTLIKGMLGLTAIVIEMVAIVKMVNGAKFTAGSGAGLVLMGISVNLFAMAIKKIGKLDTKTILKGVIGLGAVLLELAIFMKLTQKMKSGFGQFAGLILMAISVNLFARAIKKIGSLETDQIIKGIVGLGAVLLELTIFMALTKKLKSGFGQFAGLLLLAVSVMLFAKSIAKLGDMDTDKLIRGILGLGAVLLELLIFMALTKKMKVGIGKMAALLILGVAINQFVKAISSLSALDTKGLIQGLVGLGVVLVELLVFLKLLQGTKTKISNFVGLMLLAVAIKSFVKSISTIGSMDTKSLVKGIAGLGAVLLELIVFMNLTKRAKFGVSQGAALLLLGVTVNLFARAMKRIGDMSFSQILKGVIGLGAVLIEMAAFTKIVGNMSFSSLGKTMVVLLALGTALLGFSLLMQSLVDVDTSKMIAFAGSFALSILSFTAAVAVLGAIPFTAVLAGIAKAALVVTALIAFMALLGAAEKEWNISSYIDSFGNIMESIGVAIGRFVGGIGKGITAGLKDSITDFSTFIDEMSKLMDTINGIQVNEGAVDNIKSLVSVLGEIAMLNIKNTIASWISGSSSVTNFAEDIQELGKAINSYADLTSGLTKVNQKGLDRASSITTGLVDTMNALPSSGGLVQKITGAKDLGKFADDIPKLGDALSNYAVSVGTVKGVNMNQLKNVTNVAAGIAELTENIPKTGGLAQLIQGTTDYDAFTAFIPHLGAAMDAYITYVTPNMKTKVEKDAVESATAAAAGIAELTEHIPKTGGIAQFITGAADLDKFTEFIPNLGRAMAAYVENIGDGYDKKSQKIENVKAAAEGVATLAGSIPDYSFMDYLMSITGNYSDRMNKFTEFIPALGTAMKAYVDNIGDGYTKKNSAIENVRSAAEGVAALASSIPDYSFMDFLGKLNGEPDKLTKFAEWIPALGSAMAAYAENVGSKFASQTTTADAVSNATQAAIGLSQLTQNLPRTYGLKQVYEGEVDYDKFVEFLPKLGSGLKAYADELKNGDMSKIVESGDNANAISAATSLTELSKNIPRASGLKQVYEGEVDYDAFASFIPKLGKGLRAYAEELNKEGWKSFDPDSSTKAISAATSLADLATKLPDTGGLVQKIMGEKHLDTFADDIKAIGEGLGSFASSVSGVKVGDAEDAVSVMGIIQDFINQMDPEGGLFKNIGDFFSGNTTNSLLTLTANMKTVGENLKSFSTDITGADFSDLEAVKKVMGEMQEFINTLDPTGSIWQTLGRVFGGGEKDITSVSSKMSTFGSDFASFSSGISGAAQASADFAVVKGIIEAFASFGAKLNSGEINWEDIQATGETLAEYCIGGFVSGISAKTSNAEDAATGMATDAAAATNGNYKDFYDAGTYLGQGLGDGIAAMADTVNRQAQSVAAGALNSIKVTWSVNSPSKAAAELGEFFDLGLVKGLKTYAEQVSDSANEISGSVVDSARTMLRGADGSIFDYIDPNPTIRPILDMTDVNSQMSSFNSSLSNGRTIGLFAGTRFADNAQQLDTTETGALRSANNRDIVDQMEGLSDQLDAMNEAITNMQIVLDTGTLVGQTTAAYDRSLGRRLTYNSRGMRT